MRTITYEIEGKQIPRLKKVAYKVFTDQVTQRICLWETTQTPGDRRVRCADAQGIDDILVRKDDKQQLIFRKNGKQSNKDYKRMLFCNEIKLEKAMAWRFVRKINY